MAEQRKTAKSGGRGLPALAPSRTIEKRSQRQRLTNAIRFAQEITLESPKVQTRYKLGMENGDLNPGVEKALLDIAWGKPQSIDQRLLDAVGAAAGAGLIQFILRRPLTDDPLGEARVIDAKVEREPALPALTAGQVASIVPSSRPRKPKGSGPPLKPEEEVLP